MNLQLFTTKTLASIFFTIMLSVVLIFSPAIAFDDDVTAESLLVNNPAFTGDFDELVKERIIRVLMPYNKAFFFFDGPTPKGISYEQIISFEKFVNKKLKTKHLKVRIFVIPTTRKNLLPQLAKGYGDIAVGNLTITEERRKLVDFSDPFGKGVDEILVTSKDHEQLSSIFDLSGKEIYTRKSSSYYTSLIKLNQMLESVDKPPVKIHLTDDRLEDADLMEMCNAGVIPRLIVDSHKARFWTKIFPNIKTHPEVSVNSNRSIAWAIRKNSPGLKEVINEFAKTHKKGTLTGNVIFNRYLKNTKYITNSTQGESAKRYLQMVERFKKYASTYKFDHLMLLALAYQESRLDQSARSHAGAIGIMQILPSTAKDKNVGISNIEELEQNIHAGTKYLNFLRNRYFPANSEITTLNRTLFAFASYNAGPAKIAKLRREAERQGFDKNVWFNNVEVIAAKRIGRETVQYVSNILKYYVSYKLLAESQAYKKAE